MFMMAEHLLPEFKVSEDSHDTDIKNLVKIIKPSWNSDQLQIKILSGGYSSKMYRCYEENNSDDSLTIRVRHLADIIGSDISENPLELKIIQYLSTVGHFPKVHAIFQNGYCYQYIKGKPILNIRERTGHVDDRMLRTIADEMAFVHSLKTDDFEKDSWGSFYFADMLLNYLKPETQLDYGLNKNRLLKEIDLISNFFKIKSSERVLCHGDPHPGNYVWNENEEKITFVDWELTHIGYTFSEIAQFFISIRFAENVYSKDKCNKVIKDGYQEQFIKLYLEARRKLHNDNNKVTEKDVAEWMEEIKIFHMIPLLLFVLMGLIYPEIFVEAGFDLKIIDDFAKEYLKLKKKVLDKESFEME